MARQQFRRGPRRKTQWAGFGDEAGTAALSSLVTLVAGTPQIISQGMVVQGSLGLLDDEVTITRMIGQFVGLLNAIAADAEAEFAIGVLVARNEAIIAGVASLPSPEDDPDSDWLFYGQYHVAQPQASAIQGTISLNAIRENFDVRGQRIVKAGEAPVWIAESQTAGVKVGVGGRYLAKLA